MSAKVGHEIARMRGTESEREKEKKKEKTMRDKIHPYGERFENRRLLYGTEFPFFIK